MKLDITSFPFSLWLAGKLLGISIVPFFVSPFIGFKGLPSGEIYSIINIKGK